MAYFLKKLFSAKHDDSRDTSLQAIQKLNLYKSWVSAKGTIDDCRAIYRLNMGLKPFIDHPNYAHEIVFSIELNEKDKHEMPLNKQEWEALSTIERKMVPLLHEDKESLLGLIVTTDGFQDLIFYSSNKESAKAKINAVLAEVQSHKTQVAINTGDWMHYKKFLDAFEIAQ